MNLQPPDTSEKNQELRPRSLSSSGTLLRSSIRARKLGQKVLIVDDDEVMVSLLQGFLAHAGYEVIAARGGAEAIATAQDTPLVAIVVDVMMPAVSGLEVLRRLKSDQATVKVPVVVITANDHPATKEEALLAGAAAFLTKPFSPMKLLGVLRNLTEAPSPAAAFSSLFG